MDGTMAGLTPSLNQYRGRHIRYWKVLIVPVEKLAPGVIGKIQVGAEPGDSAQVSVPAWAVPVAAGTVPNAPVALGPDPPEVLFEQPARTSAPATAQAASILRALRG